MVFISQKIIKGKKRYYLEKSVRRLDGKVKKYSLYLNDYDPDKEYDVVGVYNGRLAAKIRVDLQTFAVSHYEHDSLFDDTLIRKLECMKLDYQEITKKLTKKQWEDVLDRFAVNFTYESNAIEGNSLTLKDVTFVLHENKTIKGKDLREIYETVNTKKALELVFAHKVKIQKSDIIRLHRVLVEDTDIAFGYKKLPNFLLGRKVKTTPPEKVEKRMQDLIHWYHENKKIHPLQLAADFHGRFEHIHPFEDGNGRVGRILILIMLIQAGYPPLIIRKSQRLSYFAALSAFDSKYKQKLQRFLVEKYKETYKKFFQIYMKYVSSL
jgi:Fic family protein